MCSKGTLPQNSTCCMSVCYEVLEQASLIPGGRKSGEWLSLGGRGGNQLGKALGSPVSDGSVSYFTKTGKTGVDICQTPADLIINTTPGKFYIKTKI